jgi:hypothetical protein
MKRGVAATPRRSVSGCAAGAAKRDGYSDRLVSMGDTNDSLCRGVV